MQIELEMISPSVDLFIIYMLPFDQTLSFLLGYTLPGLGNWNVSYPSCDRILRKHVYDSHNGTSSSWSWFTRVFVNVESGHYFRFRLLRSGDFNKWVFRSRWNHSQVHYPIFFKFWVFCFIFDVDIDTSIASKILALYSTKIYLLKNSHHLLNSIIIWWQTLRRRTASLSRRCDHNILANHHLPHLRLTTT